MKASYRGFAVSLATLVLGLGLAAFAKDQSFTGVVSDAMCGAKHAMPGDDAACTRACVSKGSKYALVVGDKVYTLDAKDKALDELNKLAGQKATVSGKANGDTIEVASVAAGK